MNVDSFSENKNTLEQLSNEDQEMKRRDSMGDINVPRLPTVIVNPQKL